MTDTSATPHALNWYADSSQAARYPQLQGEIQADVCVVGAGIAGCSAALHLAERGYRVVVLEAEQVGFGASGRSGGQCLPGVSCGQNTLERLLDPSLARAAWELTIEGLQLQQQLIKRHRIDCDWRPGHLQVCCHARHERELRAELEHLQRVYDYQAIDWIDRASIAEQVGSPRYQSGALDRQAGHLHPLKYTQGLARAAVNAGATLFEKSRALSRQPRGNGWRVMSAQGAVCCQQVVLAGNATLGRSEPALQRKILGVGTYMIATAPLPMELAQKLLPQDVAVADMNWIIDYFRLSADRRMLFGGEVSYGGLHPSRHAQALRQRMQRVFPELSTIPITHHWGGWLDITVNRAPHFGEIAPQVYFVQGFSGHGLALAGIAGKLLAEAVAGTRERFDVFAHIPHHEFPGGLWLRRPALMLAMLWYRLRDRLG
jgi:gamma-glutamylputrescine oxidase